MNVVIPRRKLGVHGLEVSAMGLGCMGMSDFYGPADDLVSLQVLNHAVDIGLNFLDTADMYGVMGANERLLAQLLRQRRNEVTIATKFGFVRSPEGAYLGINGRPEYVRQACDASLRRLGVDHIDLYYQHRVDRNVPIEETVGAMADLVTEGKVRYLGLSEASGETVRRAAKVHAISALQSEYSLWTREVENDALPVCQELGIGFVAYSPLGRGFLTGTLQSEDELDPSDWRRQVPRFQSDNLKENLLFVNAVVQLAKQRGCAPGQLALAWLLHRGVVPIPGTRHVERLEENAASATMSLSDEEVRRIDDVLQLMSVRGERLPAAGMASVNV
ncbi:aldo/keto reductase [Burkholderia ubonensis]|uniref:aldo/keto reductase n=1 Tax=Burkholderia ubonensis TaxID=101571 RepID=UPI0021A9B6CF|nr:aldo/keto reductase [Burkholderia ubonensis]